MRQMKKIIFCLLVFSVITILAGCTNNETPPLVSEITVQVQILFPQQTDKIDLNQEVPLKKDATVLNALLQMAKEQNLQITIDKDSKTSIKSIDSICNGDYGVTTGWIYTVNDKASSKAASDYILSDGDVVIWKYANYTEH